MNWIHLKQQVAFGTASGMKQALPNGNGREESLHELCGGREHTLRNRSGVQGCNFDES